MKKLFPLLIVGLFLAFVGRQIAHAAWTEDLIAPGGTGSATPKAVGTSTPVQLLPCSTTLNLGQGNTNTNYIKFEVFGGTVGTDGCYISSAPLASPGPCSAASPAPNASTQVGDYCPTGGQPCIYNYFDKTGPNQLNAEWDGVCTASGMKIKRITN